jgi:hypothetical protein
MSVKEIIVNNVNLDWVQIEAIMNGPFISRGWNDRIRCEPINNMVTKVVLRKGDQDYVIGIHLKDTNELLRIDGSLSLHWRMMVTAFSFMYEGITVVK